MRKNLFGQVYENISISYLGYFLITIISFITSVYIIRKLCVEDYGHYQILMGTIPFIMMLCSFGTTSVIQRFIPEFFEIRNYFGIKIISITCILLKILAVGFVLLILANNLDKVLHFLNVPEIKNYAHIFFVAVLIFVEISTIQIILTSLFLVKYNVVIDTLGAILRFWLYFHAIKTGQGLKGIIFYFLIINIFLCISYSVVYYLSVFRLKSRQELEPIKKKRIIKFGALSYFNEVSYSLYDSSVDYYIISYFMGPTYVGYYSFAFVTLQKIVNWLPSKMVANLITPTITRRYYEKNDVTELNIMFKLYNKTIVFFVMPAMIGLIVLGDKIIIFIFDPKYLESLKIVYLFAIFEIINSVYIGAGVIVKVLEKVKILLFSRITAIYNFIGAIAFIKYFGLLGVAFATGSAIFFNRMIIYFYIKKHVYISSPYNSHIKILINSLFMGLIVYISRNHVTSIVSLLTIVIIGAIIYAITSYLNLCFNDGERKIINKILGRELL